MLYGQTRFAYMCSLGDLTPIGISKISSPTIYSDLDNFVSLLNKHQLRSYSVTWSLDELLLQLIIQRLTRLHMFTKADQSIIQSKADPGYIQPQADQSSLLALDQVSTDHTPQPHQFYHLLLVHHLDKQRVLTILQINLL